MQLFKTLMIAMATCACASGPLIVTVDFRDSASVNDTVIRLQDIAIVRSALRLGPIENLLNIVVGEAAPAGYCRRVNTTEVVNYVMKKTGANAGFSFSTTRPQAVLVATAFTEKRVGDFEHLIIKYLCDSVKWQPGDYTVSVKNVEEKWKCLDKPVDAQVTGLSSKYPKGNVNLKLIARQNSRVVSVPVVCCVTVVTPVITVKTAVRRGSMLSQENCSLERKDITHFAGNPFTDLSQLNDLIANRTIQPETILYDKLTSRMPIIGKDEQVYVVVDRGQVRVSIIMRAREQGALGDKIWVENELTHKLLKTKIVGKGKVELLEGVKTI